MVAEGCGWVEGMRAAGWQVDRREDRDAYIVRGPNPEREGDMVVFEVTGQAIAAARSTQQLINYLFGMMRETVYGANREPSRIAYHPPERRLHRGAVQEFFDRPRMLDPEPEVAGYAPEQPTHHHDISVEQGIEAEVKAKLYLKDLIGAEQLVIYCDSNLVGLSAGGRGWLIGNINRPGDKVDPAWAPEVGMPDSKEIRTFCINTVHTEWLPFTDQVIALALMVMAKPQWFYSEANPIDTLDMDHSLNPARFALQ
jgi:hypothetical protein